MSNNSLMSLENLGAIEQQQYTVQDSNFEIHSAKLNKLSLRQTSQPKVEYYGPGTVWDQQRLPPSLFKGTKPKIKKKLTVTQEESKVVDIENKDDVVKLKEQLAQAEAKVKVLERLQR